MDGWMVFDPKNLIANPDIMPGDTDTLALRMIGYLANIILIKIYGSYDPRFGFSPLPSTFQRNLHWPWALGLSHGLACGGDMICPASRPFSARSGRGPLEGLD